MNNKLITTPVGESIYAKVFQADEKFGTYSISLKLKGDDAKAFKKMLDDELAVALAEAQKKNKNARIVYMPYEEGPYNLSEPSEDYPNRPLIQIGEDEIVVKFKQKEHITAKDGTTYKKEIKVVDSLTNDVSGILIGNGSKVKVGANIRHYYVPAQKAAGISLQLRSVQIIDLVEYKKSEFEKVDGGFVAPVVQEAVDTGEATGEELPF